ncbi:MAG: YdcF family protein [Bacteroidota bacterium]|nr:YdcF family protein [Bacteroidota bacterium]
MFFYLSKILHFLIAPLTWFMMLAIVARFVKQPERKRRWWVAAFLVLIIFSNPFLANEAMQLWEMAPVNVNSIHEPYDVGILLGGSLRSYDQQIARPVYSQSVDRLLQTIALYKGGKIKKILLSGGSGSVTRPDERESEIILKVLEQTGIPASDIIIENASRNTFENAVYTADILKKNYPSGRFLLITSSFHMRRSQASFIKTGLEITIFPVDPRAHSNIYTPENALFPHAGALLIWDALIHEWIGILTYKLAGYT